MNVSMQTNFTVCRSSQNNLCEMTKTALFMRMRTIDCWFNHYKTFSVSFMEITSSGVLTTVQQQSKQGQTMSAHLNLLLHIQ